MDSETEVYARRWYILIIFSIFAFIQNAVNCTWGAIADTCDVVFPEWGPVTISIFTNYSNVFLAVFLVPICWLITEKGIRVGMLLGTATTAIGASLRCITSQYLPATILIHIAQFIVGSTSVVSYTLPAHISSVWFPPRERTTATSISFGLLNFGLSGCSIIGPLFTGFVPYNKSSFYVPDTNQSSPSYQAYVEQLTRRVMYLMYTEAGICIAIFVIVLIYFPDAPPKPPSPSARETRLSFLKGIKALISNVEVWKMGISFSILCAFFLNWTAMFSVFSGQVRMSESDAGIVVAGASVVGTITATLYARYLDHIGNKMKISLLIFLILWIVCFTVFALTYFNCCLPDD